jgi:aspartate aminotransferase
MFSERIKLIPPSPTLTVSAKAKAMKLAGIDIISLSNGELDFATPQHIKEAAIRALKEGFTKYTPVDGISELKEAIIRFLEVEYGLRYSLEEVIVCCGGKHALYNLFQVILNPGDEVIIPSPYWVSYPPLVSLAGGRPIIIQTEKKDGFKLKAEALKPHLSPWTKALILNNPSNPTGSLYTKTDLETLVEVLVDKNIWIVSDDIYHKILLKQGAKWTSIASLSLKIKEKTLIINGVSKTYAMTGWRIGFLVAPKDIVKAATRLQSQSTSNPNSIAQKAAVAALSGPQEFISEWIKILNKRLTSLLGGLKELVGLNCFVPEATFYAFADFSYYLNKKVSNSVKLAEYLLEKAKVAVVPGVAFGKEGFIRVSFTIPTEDIKEALNRIKEALQGLS